MTDEELVRQYLELSNSGQIEAAAALEVDDMHYWISGRLLVSGELKTPQRRKAAAGVHDTFPGGYTLHIRSVTAADGRVAVEAQGEGVLPDGTRYTPSYAMFFDVADGRIASMREYIDTEYVGATFSIPVRS